ncbi:MAG: Uma2 family endonuclease [Anaerolineae bacterium]|nr:Uma2 family endonuclease [Anaerolineae bacterium]
MDTPTLSQAVTHTAFPVSLSGTVLARDVSHEDFLAGYPGRRVEWVNGVVIDMPGVTLLHDAIVRFLENLLEYYLEATGGGRICTDPVLMRLPGIATRAPDVQVLRPENSPRLQATLVDGPADLVIEIISPGSRRTDTVEKFLEYEAGGVPEYWIIDPEHREAYFYRRGEAGQYERFAPDAQGVYHSRSLPRLHLRPEWLWRDPRPGLRETLALVEAMLSAPAAG